MKRWCGWGNPETSYPLADSARDYLESIVGKPEPVSDISLDDALTRVPPSRLPPIEKFLTDPLERLSHASGQSLPDWVAIHSGGIPAYPDAVVYPESDNDLEAIFYRRQKTERSPDPLWRRDECSRTYQSACWRPSGCQRGYGEDEPDWSAWTRPAGWQLFKQVLPDQPWKISYL